MGPDLPESIWKVVHFVEQNSSSLELLLYQSEPLIEAGILTLILDLASIVKLVHKNIHRLLHSLRDHQKITTHQMIKKMID